MLSCLTMPKRHGPDPWHNKRAILQDKMMKIAILISGRGSNMAALAENRQGLKSVLLPQTALPPGWKQRRKMATEQRLTARISRKAEP